MSFRIQVDPDATVLLRSLSPHVVLQLGHALAELAEATSIAPASPLSLASGRLDVAGCTALYDVDREGQTIRVTYVEQRTELSPDIAAVPA